MAKRFTDSDKFRDTWYRKLKPHQKCLWEYLLCQCSLAGIAEIDLEAASFHIGCEITENDLNALSKNFYRLPDGKIFIARFVRFQQGELNRKNKAHKNIFTELNKYGIPETLDTSGIRSPFQGASKGLLSSTSISKGNSKGISNSITARAKNEISASETGEQMRRLQSLIGGTTPLDMSMMVAWINSGADFELDIFLTVDRIMKKRGDDPPPTSLKYFQNAVLESVANRQKKLTLPEWGNHEQRKSNSSSWSSEADRIAEKFRGQGGYE